MKELTETTKPKTMQATKLIIQRNMNRKHDCNRPPILGYFAVTKI